jgi:hypothetical protein
MNKLYDLVKFKNDLRDTVNSLSLEKEVEEKLAQLENIKVRHTVQEYDQDIDRCGNAYRQLLEKNDLAINVIKEVIQKIESDLDKNNAEQQHSDAYQKRFSELSIGQELFTITDDLTENIIQNRIGSYSNWKYPGLHLHCRYFTNADNQDSNKYANHQFRIGAMVSADPLYLVGKEMFALEQLISHFPEVYQRRLRLYETTTRDLSMLPQNQFGFVFSWDFFNCLPLTAIEDYFQLIIRILRPGGVFMFNYNNCEFERSAGLVEDRQACWATPKLIKQIIERTGFELLVEENYPVQNFTNPKEDAWVSWMEIKKPGELSTIKLHQVLGSIRGK